jgi:hypothetical protein
VWNDGFSIACDAVKMDMGRIRLVEYFIDGLDLGCAKAQPRPIAGKQQRNNAFASGDMTIF